MSVTGIKNDPVATKNKITLFLFGEKYILPYIPKSIFFKKKKITENTLQYSLSVPYFVEFEKHYQDLKLKFLLNYS